MLLLLLQLLLLCSLGYTLTCSQSDDEGNFEAVTDPTWKFCALIPASKGNPAAAFGIPEDDQIEYVQPYKELFGQNDRRYGILSVCLYERYPATAKSPMTEYQFRCICNYDNCNKNEHFLGYMKDLRHHQY